MYREVIQTKVWNRIKKQMILRGWGKRLNQPKARIYLRCNAKVSLVISGTSIIQ